MTPPVYTVSEIAKICHGRVIARGQGDPVIHDILIDSRRLIHPDHCLFVALVTEINDGHKYIPDLCKKGVRCFLVEEKNRIIEQQNSRTTEFLNFEGESGSGAYLIVVKDTLVALQVLAGHHRRQFEIPVIGITGSNGKTIVKEWLFQLLNEDFRIVRSPKSYNSQVGVPLSVWKMGPLHNLAIFEAGISKPGEMEKLAAIIQPTTGILTNIGQAHDEHFSDRAEKTDEKLKLFPGVEQLVYCSDYENLTKAIGENPSFDKVKLFTWSRNGTSDVRVKTISKESGKTLITGVYLENQFKLAIPFTDEASIENAMHVVTVMFLLNYSAAEIESRCHRLIPIAMRLELKEAINHCSLINDSYNSDFNSLSIALDFLFQQNTHQRKTVILSDILQTGKDRKELFMEISALLSSRGIDRIIGIGRDMVRYGHLFPMEHALYQTTDEFITHFPFSSFQHETILLKGARLFEFEKIDQLLQQKAHETVMEINLDALTYNLNYYRSLLNPGTRVMAMVKAFSYGSGSFEIANLLQFHRADYLAVAYADEGVELRNAGIQLPVMVMSPEEQSLENLLKYNLEPEIYNLHILGLLERAMERHVTSIQQEVLVHIKLDTGMHRLGFQEYELDALIPALLANPNIRVQSLFSHLASSEDPADDNFTRNQILSFQRMSFRIEQAIGYPVLRHILNSAGISRFPEAQFDMVRLGIGLYGVGHNEEEQRQLRNVSTLRSVITQIKRLPSGDAVGYNRKGTLERDTTIAVVPVGYADGLDRRLGNGKGRLFVAGQPAPVIGNICMDLTMIDITDISEKMMVDEGTQVVIFDDTHPVNQMAATIGTIPYEVLTGISRRVKRIYYYE